MQQQPRQRLSPYLRVMIWLGLAMLAFVLIISTARAIFVLNYNASNFPPKVSPGTIAPIPFSHKVHADQGITCRTCHGADSTLGKLPAQPKNLCSTCHTKGAADTSLASAHLQPADITASPYTTTGHQQHVNLKVKCEVCHSTPKVELTDEMIRMVECAPCHHKPAPDKDTAGR